MNEDFHVCLESISILTIGQFYYSIYFGFMLFTIDWVGMFCFFGFGWTTHVFVAFSWNDEWRILHIFNVVEHVDSSNAQWKLFTKFWAKAKEKEPSHVFKYVSINEQPNVNKEKKKRLKYLFWIIKCYTKNSLHVVQKECAYTRAFIRGNKEEEKTTITKRSRQLTKWSHCHKIWLFIFPSANLIQWW